MLYIKFNRIILDEAKSFIKVKCAGELVGSVRGEGYGSDC